MYNTDLVQYRWTGLDLLTADRLKMQDWKIVNSSKYSKLLYLRFPLLQIRTCVFRTCIFHPCTFVLTYSVLAYSILRYFRFPYLRFQSPRFFSPGPVATIALWKSARMIKPSLEVAPAPTTLAAFYLQTWPYIVKMKQHSTHSYLAQRSYIKSNQSDRQTDKQTGPTDLSGPRKWPAIK